MSVLLDTSAYSAFMRGQADVVEALRRANAVVLTPVVLGELSAGFRRGRQRARNEALLGRFLASPRVQVIPLDEGTAERYAVILNALWTAGTPIPTNDVWIAASAMQHGLVVLTMDAHYQKVAQILVDFRATR